MQERNPRKEIEAELQKLKAFFDTATDPAWMLDADGAIRRKSTRYATVHPVETNSPGELVQQADSALYGSKGQGKNCVMAYQPNASVD